LWFFTSLVAWGIRELSWIILSISYKEMCSNRRDYLPLSKRAHMDGNKFCNEEAK